MIGVVVFRLVVVALVLSACVSSSSSHVVSWVVDGDTFYVEELDASIRISNVDAPELPSPLGWDAKWFLVDLIYDESITLSCDGVDRYGRHLCLVFFDGSDVGLLLHSRGLARLWVD
jgi:endonuclease YncB( thermonuclease family)